MSLKKNYGDSHDLFVVSSKRFDISPYISKYYDKKIVFESVDQLKNSITVMNEVLKNFIVNKKRMLSKNLGK